jgi:hypothetical protein
MRPGWRRGTGRLRDASSLIERQRVTIAEFKIRLVEPARRQGLLRGWMARTARR